MHFQTQEETQHPSYESAQKGHVGVHFSEQTEADRTLKLKSTLRISLLILKESILETKTYGS